MVVYCTWYLGGCGFKPWLGKTFIFAKIKFGHESERTPKP